MSGLPVKFENLPIETLSIAARDAFEDCLASLGKALDKAKHFGRILLIVREKIPHGEWIPWIDETFDDKVSLRTIQRYMQIANASETTLLEGARSIEDAIARIGVKQAAVEVVELNESDEDADDKSTDDAECETNDFVEPSEVTRADVVEAAKTPEKAAEVLSRPHVSNNSGNNEWYTPAEFCDSAHVVMGGIDLDPASCKVANKQVRAKKFWTAEQNALTKEWSGRVWLNPPYGQPLISEFAKKLVEEWQAGRVQQAIALVNNATETAWFQLMAAEATAMCFKGGRIKFLDSTGTPANTPLQGQVFLYFGTEPGDFVTEFSKYGVCTA